MNKVFLIGKIITKIEFKFIVNSKKMKSISFFKLESVDKQIISIVGYNEMADFVFSKMQQNNRIFLQGHYNKERVELEYVEKIKNK